MNIFAIGDIHGCLKQLVTLQDKIFNYPKYNKDEDLLLYLGDYIDRGPSSKDVINHILQLQTEGIKSIFLMGNHEQFMIDFLFNKINNLSSWLMNGADQTFKSYDIEVAEFIKDGFEDDNIDKLRDIFLSKLTKEHVYFFKNLKLTYIMGDYLFVHAGINPEKYLFIPLFIIFFLEIWPIKSTGSFFTTWNATFLWLNVAILFSIKFNKSS